MKGRPGNPGLKGKLLDKSIEAYILSLEIINQLSVRYRVETFSYLICNAWELLLKAKLLEYNKKRGVIYYRKKRGQLRRSLSLADCLKRVFTNEKEPTRRNLERIAELRDASVHLVINQMPKDILGLFQACVLNYHKYLTSWFSISLSDRVSVGMMAIVYDFSPQQLDLRNAMLRKQLSRDAFQYLCQFQTQIGKEFNDLGKPAEFSIDIDYRLALVKNVGESDITLTGGQTGTTIGIVEVPKDPGKTHPYREKELIDEVNAKLGSVASINQYDIRCIVKVYQIKKRPEFHYKGRVLGSPTQYSPRFVDWILHKHDADSQFFVKTRQKARRINKLKGKNLEYRT
jgi:hypothetical protein